VDQRDDRSDLAERRSAPRAPEPLGTTIVPTELTAADPGRRSFLRASALLGVSVTVLPHASAAASPVSGTYATAPTVLAISTTGQVFASAGGSVWMRSPAGTVVAQGTVSAMSSSMSGGITRVVAVGTDTSGDTPVPVGWRSEDAGATWTATAPFRAGTTTPTAVGATLIVGDADGGISASSVGGQGWTSRVPLAEDAIRAVAAAGETFLVADRSGAVFRNPFLGFSTWSAAIGTGLMGQTGLAYGAGTFVVIGPGGQVARSGDDGLTWTAATTPPDGEPPLTALAVGGPDGTRFVAVATDGRTSISMDGGDTWTTGGSTTAGLTAVSWAGDTFVAVGPAGSAHVSTDGLTWSAAMEPPALLPGGSTDLVAVVSLV
jgi:hypothetical protein